MFHSLTTRSALGRGCGIAPDFGLFFARIQKFDASGTFLTTWGSYGVGAGQFDSPKSIATDGSGNVYVADTGNDRIEKYTNTGTFLTKWGSSGSGDGEFSEPYGVAVDEVGNIYVADSGNGRIQKFACP